MQAEQSRLVLVLVGLDSVLPKLMDMLGKAGLRIPCLNLPGNRPPPLRLLTISLSSSTDVSSCGLFKTKIVSTPSKVPPATFLHSTCCERSRPLTCFCLLVVLSVSGRLQTGLSNCSMCHKGPMSHSTVVCHTSIVFC